MKLLRNIALPIVPIYYLVTSIRNKFYDWGIKKSTSFNFPVICVGNLSVGGTGKTPMIEYLIRLLKDDYKVATLSRGYKRKTQGFQLADESSNAETLGDEPFQFYNKFKGNIQVAVDANRVNGIGQLRLLEEQPEVILLDDAYQHRKVKAGFNILLTTYSNLYVNDVVLPTGNLREPKRGAKRADIIVITKCPEHLDNAEKEAILGSIAPLDHQHVFFSHIQYASEVRSLDKRISLDDLKSFTLVTGIANARPLVEFLKQKGLNFEHLNFKDHHEFSVNDIEKLKGTSHIVTTEKDFVRLKKFEALKDRLYYLPIETKIDDSKAFDSLLRNFVERY
ncbi:tetraacyldisaccharide 4'-kinase [Aestuariivivens insulae]|uniref:tetraacyldisaccharide 4'-kinase n=1 Tax=Aestuariivivens insulae TaxID=1621988 RepID=UPI001F578FAA|nr:tetraacyldisaccharide 4'-kinase [Aestuariivivens insulae]